MTLGLDGAARADGEAPPVWEKTRVELWNIGVPGAIGGFVAWLLSLRTGPLIEGLPIIGPLGALVLCLLCGAGAGLAFVVVMSNTDRRDATRVVVLSFLAGIAWEPIMAQALGSLVSREDYEQVQRANEALGAVAGGLSQLSELGEREREVASGDDKEEVREIAQEIALDTVRRLETGAPTDGAVAELPEEALGALREAQGVLLSASLRRLELENQQEIALGWGDLEVPAVRPYFDDVIERKIPSRVVVSERPGMADAVTVRDGTGTLTVDARYMYEADDGVETVFVTVEIEVQGRYRIEVRGEDGDLVASLYDERGVVVAADDDTLGMLNPLVRPAMLLEVNEVYYLRVASFNDGEVVPDFGAVLVREEGGASGL